MLGRNGSGTSTFLNILVRETTTTTTSTTTTATTTTVRYSMQDDIISFTGLVEKAKTCDVAYVEQEPPMTKQYGEQQ